MAEIFTLSEDDITQISKALSLIWRRTKYRLRNVTITDNIANISYGKRIDRITVNLEDSNYIITDQDSEKNCDVEHVKKIDQLQEKLLIAEKTYEKLKIKNKQLNDELNSLQIYNHNLEKKINKFRRKSDQINMSKSSSTIVSSSDSEDEDNTSLQRNNDHINILVNDLHQMGFTIESNPDDVWESLNKRCHEKFGFEELIKESTDIEELRWAEKTLPSYTIWDKFNQYYLLVELWINKVNITLMKKKEEGRNMVVENFEKKVIASKESQESEKKKKYSNFGKSLNSLVVKTIENKTLVEIKDYQIRTNFNQALKVMTSEPIQITDEESAKERITQWVDQKNHSKQVELATKAYKLYHRMSLVYIYNDLHIISVEKHPNDEREQRRFERNFMCTQLGIHTRTERRQKKSAFRIYKLINIGITLDQLVNTGLNISNFEVTDYYYDIFLTDLKLGTIKILFQNPNMQDNMDLDTEDSESNESNVAN
ncbi:uncharacterized protein OCT59_017125 [Rhizophagus irregularis]|uniref:Uncharacterized protein n=1 Tax=Rhizophagus irregularis (strain DAOM 181602 / DAOM 197198 / MUCL 43194) TaxID=747089 RepID=A0A2P4NMX0_RHIID|nr:hypothetical protein GLOIN_2v1098880 [Rhizophagus irregularis DAOM 181602=DAOM 197198]POG54471.1 hypothetical protein GLOIN_2v1098880 [Rhizophagus irregularis DAOM 181602=DAOM 197198]UZO24831.1 hypothetical protein OCT59_017125 [Rhizophagus irregularis]GET52892.1 hypothetical protein GLOIN_2v1098880 [Rhizophagus irregularis DAOM 181602=DAOM 197198]|eukprot:XP_025164236.1 hypothetical protein GLOIN_2v1098880 [Rhizophagus irregularis DAOM 181602=DAOM 197198]